MVRRTWLVVSVAAAACADEAAEPDPQVLETGDYAVTLTATGDVTCSGVTPGDELAGAFHMAYVGDGVHEMTGTYDPGPTFAARSSASVGVLRFWSSVAWDYPLEPCDEVWEDRWTVEPYEDREGFAGSLRREVDIVDCVSTCYEVWEMNGRLY